MDPIILRLAAGRVDWALFLQMVVQERAEAIVAARLGRLGVKLPDKEQHALKSVATRSDLRMATLSHRLDQTLVALAAAGIPVLLLKGAALGRTVYGSVPRRPMLDIDLLVPPEQANRACQAAQNAGWVTRAGDQAVEPFRGHFHLPPLADGTGAGNLEVHTGLFIEGNPFSWPLEDIWARSRPLTVGPGRVPAPEDLLLHILLHFSWSHVAQMGPWRTFRDVRTLAESQTMEWERFLALVRSTGGEAPAFWTLRLARLSGITEVPGAVEEAIRPVRLRVLEPLLERHFAGQWFPAEGPCPSRRMERALWRVAMGGLGRRGEANLPWAREAAFLPAEVSRESESLPAKLLRHLTGLGAYGRYFRRVAFGQDL